MAETLTKDDFAVETLGECLFDSPLDLARFEDETHRIVIPKPIEAMSVECVPLEKSGARKKIFFEPENTIAAIVTCGGLCPGMNNVIRSLVMCLKHQYKVKTVLGLRFGFQGLTHTSEKNSAVELTPDHACVKNVHHFGGTSLGTSRGPQSVQAMAAFVKEMNINILFGVGGDGTMKGMNALSDELDKEGIHISVVGIPKTIDNDILFTDRSFGFETACDLSRSVITGAKAECTSHENGISIVKLMGRESGFVALTASIASSEVNICLTPEVPFTFEKVAALVEKRLETRGHVLIVVAEGAGQELLARGSKEYDASGNVKLLDIGLELKSWLERHLKSKGIEHTIKYLDPSYYIRSAPANVGDSILCTALATAAVHAAMAGKTKLFVSLISNHLAHIPIKLACLGRKKLDVRGHAYTQLLQSTGMPLMLA